MSCTFHAETRQVYGSATWHSRFEKLHCDRLIIQFCIIQRCLYVPMPEQGLQGKDRHAGIEQERRAGVAELMRRDFDIHLFAKRLQAGLAVAIAQGIVMADEEIFACVLSIGKIGLNGFHCWRTEKRHTLTLILGFSDTNSLLGKINIISSQAADFAGAESAVEHQQEPSAIHVVVNGIEKQFDLFSRQVTRQGLTRFQ